MESLAFTFTVLFVLGLAFAIWLHTKSGKKWLSSLD